MELTQTKPVDWETILETYGPETKMTLYKLLSDNGIPDTDPAALVIAALFISQIDSNRAFLSLTETIDTGKKELHEQFEMQVLQLRGVITYAKEHLVEAGGKQVDERKQELLDTIKEGIAKALGNRHRSSSKQNTAQMVALIVGVAATSLVSVLASGTAVYMMAPKTTVSTTDTSSAWKDVPRPKLWADIAVKNDTQLSQCMENFSKLEGRCPISIPTK